MAAAYSGKSHPPQQLQPWREQDEERIRQWLAGNPPPLPQIPSRTLSITEQYWYPQIPVKP